MTAVRWEGAKRQIRQISRPAISGPGGSARAQPGTVRSSAATSFAPLRKNSGLTQVQVAGAMSVPQTRVSQIGHGKITESDASRTYSEALALQPARRWPGAVSDWTRAVGEPVRRWTYCTIRNGEPAMARSENVRGAAGAPFGSFGVTLWTLP